MTTWLELRLRGKSRQAELCPSAKRVQVDAESSEGEEAGNRIADGTGGSLRSVIISIDIVGRVPLGLDLSIPWAFCGRRTGKIEVVSVFRTTG